MNNNKKTTSLTLAGHIITWACLIPALWLFYDRIEQMQGTELQAATIIKCDYKWSRRVSSTGSRTSRTSYTPIAITEQGDRARGTLWWPSRKFCERSLNKSVSVFVHARDPGRNRINSFFQFWMFPTLALYFGVVVIISVYTRRYWMNTVLTLVLIAVAVISYFRELHPTPEKPWQTGQGDRSQRVLDRCISNYMKDKGLTDRSQVTYLLCQDSGITDLSSISDLTNLEELYLQGNKLSSLETIGTFPKMRKISVASNGMVSLKGIERLPNLEELQANLNKINDLSGVQHLGKLKVVGLMKNQIKSIAEFENLSQLEDIVFNYNQISDISPLANKPALKELQIYSNNVRDITPLYENINMTIVGIRGKGNVSCDQIEVMRSKLAPDAKVWGQKGC